MLSVCVYACVCVCVCLRACMHVCVCVFFFLLITNGLVIQESLRQKFHHKFSRVTILSTRSTHEFRSTGLLLDMNLINNTFCLLKRKWMK